MLFKFLSAQGCTGVPDLGLRSCCDEHDEAYKKGGTEQQREAADRRLRDCIIRKGGFWRRLQAWTYYAVVRTAGSRRWKYVKAAGAGE